MVDALVLLLRNFFSNPPSPSTGEGRVGVNGSFLTGITPNPGAGVSCSQREKNE